MANSVKRIEQQATSVTLSLSATSSSPALSVSPSAATPLLAFLSRILGCSRLVRRAAPVKYCDAVKDR